MTLPLRRAEFVPGPDFDPAAWYLSLPVVEVLRRDGIEFTAPVTVIVGENGAGKSTLVEAIAESWVGPRTYLDVMWSPGRTAGDTDLARHVRCLAAEPRPAGGGFLRAELMQQSFDQADRARPRDSGPRWNELSHGQSFLRYIAERPVGVGLWVLDEPEAALSFQSCLALLGVLMDLAAEGSQVIMATHSPLLAACPDADVWEINGAGITGQSWDELGLVRDYRAFMESPARYLRHL